MLTGSEGYIMLITVRGGHRYKKVPERIILQYSRYLSIIYENIYEQELISKKPTSNSIWRGEPEMFN